VGVIDRLARKIVAEGVPLDRAKVAGRVATMLPTEAPLLGREAASAVVDAVLGFGPLEPLLRDPAVSDVLVNADGAVWVERSGRLEESAARFSGPGQLEAAIGRVLAPLGLRLDPASPAVDARLSDGSRIHAMVPPASVDGPILAIRRFTEAVSSLEEMIESTSITAGGATILRDLVAGRCNIIVCGATGSGKTTLLNVLAHEIPFDERVVTIEDAAELRLPGPVVRLESRPANAEGVGAISQRRLLRHALRLRPDRIIVGEVRGDEAFDMIQALSTGHEGSMSTVHAGSPDEALWRVETLALLEPAATPETVGRQIKSVVHAVVVVGRRLGRRVVRGIWTLDPEPVEVYSCS